MQKSIDVFEKFLGFDLPDDYKSFVDHGDLNAVEGKYFDIPEGQGKSRVHVFYTLNSEHTFSRLDLNFDELKGRLPPCCLPIAGDPFGNQVCVLLSGSGKGSIWFWDHESGHSDASKAVVQLSSSFSNFVESLHEYTPVDEGAMEGLLEKSDVLGVGEVIRAGYDVESMDKYGRTLLERAVIKNRPEIVAYLFNKGARLRSAQLLAQKNREYFPEFENMVRLLRELDGSQDKGS